VATGDKKPTARTRKKEETEQSLEAFDYGSPRITGRHYQKKLLEFCGRASKQVGEEGGQNQSRRSISVGKKKELCVPISLLAAMNTGKGGEQQLQVRGKSEGGLGK